MILYLDTSVLVAFFVEENHSDRAVSFFRGKQSTDLALSDWTTTELSAALAAKVRSGSLDRDLLRSMLGNYDDLKAGGPAYLRIGPSTFRRAAELAADVPSGLRSGDALHLAVALEHRATLVTLDKRLAHAAEQLGHSAQLL